MNFAPMLSRPARHVQPGSCVQHTPQASRGSALRQPRRALSCCKSCNDCAPGNRYLKRATFSNGRGHDQTAATTGCATARTETAVPCAASGRRGTEKKLSPRPKYEAEAYRAAGKLEGKVALITGGDSGIGRAVAVLFAREGADVAITYLPQEQTDARRNATGGREGRPSKCLAIAGRPHRSGVLRRCRRAGADEFGKLDILGRQRRAPKSQAERSRT